MDDLEPKVEVSTEEVVVSTVSNVTFTLTAGGGDVAEGFPAVHTVLSLIEAFENDERGDPEDQDGRSLAAMAPFASFPENVTEE